MLSNHVKLFSKQMTHVQSSKCHKRNSHCLPIVNLPPDTLSDSEYSANNNQLIKTPIRISKKCQL